MNLSPQQGKACAVRGEDGMWHRALVLHVGGDKQVKVRLVDHAKQIWRKQNDVGELDPKYLKLPPLAYYCALEEGHRSSRITEYEISKEIVPIFFTGNRDRHGNHVTQILSTTIQVGSKF